MTPEQVEAVQQSLARVSPRIDEVADDFYRRLFDAHPEVRSLFPDDLAVLQQKFALELAAIVDAIPDFGAFQHRASQLGARHRGYGVRAAHYPQVRESLLAALAVADPSWDPAIAHAWTSAYDLVAELMLSG